MRIIFHISRGSSLHGTRVENSTVIQQVSSYNFNMLKTYPAFKFIHEISLENLDSKYGKQSKDLDKKEIMIGRKSVFLTQKAWLDLQKSSANDFKEEEIMYAASENESDTASHYGSEFEVPGTGNESLKYTNIVHDSKEELKLRTLENQERPKTRLRKNWLMFVRLTTFCFPTACLRACKMREKERQTAWREKVALCWIIFLMNASLLFLIIGTGWIICRPTPQLSPGQISGFNNYDNSALVYMYGTYYSAFPSISGKIHQDERNNKEFWKAEILGKDASLMFPKDFGQAWADFW